MEKKQLLVIGKNDDFFTKLKAKAGVSFDLVCIKSVHAGYSLALSYLPEVILIDQTSLDLNSLKNIQSFKSTHFLNKSHLFLYAEAGKREEIKELEDQVDRVFYDSCSIKNLFKEIEDLVAVIPSFTNYWKDSFLGLFNLLGQPVVLLQDDHIIAMNDSFKKYFFIKDPAEIKLTDFVDCRNKYKVLETLKNFSRGKHMKATATTSLLLMNNKLREAKITFSKLDKSINDQMLMMINFTGNESPLNEDIGTASEETSN